LSIINMRSLSLSDMRNVFRASIAVMIRRRNMEDFERSPSDRRLWKGRGSAPDIFELRGGAYCRASIAATLIVRWMPADQLGQAIQVDA
jgi:hypothetical protein